MELCYISFHHPQRWCNGLRINKARMEPFPAESHQCNKYREEWNHWWKFKMEGFSMELLMHILRIVEDGTTLFCMYWLEKGNLHWFSRMFFITVGNGCKVLPWFSCSRNFKQYPADSELQQTKTSKSLWLGFAGSSKKFLRLAIFEFWFGNWCGCDRLGSRMP